MVTLNLLPRVARQLRQPESPVFDRLTSTLSGGAELVLLRYCYTRPVTLSSNRWRRSRLLI